MGGSHKVTVQWKLTWQQSDSLLNPGFAVSVAHYFSITSALKCHHGLVLTKHSWPQQQKQKVIEKILLMTPKLRSIPFFVQECKKKINLWASKCAYCRISIEYNV